MYDIKQIQLLFSNLVKDVNTLSSQYKQFTIPELTNILNDYIDKLRADGIIYSGEVVLEIKGQTQITGTIKIKQTYWDPEEIINVSEYLPKPNEIVERLKNTYINAVINLRT